MLNTVGRNEKRLLSFDTLDNFIGVDLVEENVLMIFFRKKVDDPNLKLYTEDNVGKKLYCDLSKGLEWIGECPYYLQRYFVKFDTSVNKLGIEYTGKNREKSLELISLSKHAR